MDKCAIVLYTTGFGSMLIIRELHRMLRSSTMVQSCGASVSVSTPVMADTYSVIWRFRIDVYVRQAP